MPNIPEREARALLGRRLLCREYDEWIELGKYPNAFLLQAGLLNELGEATGLTVELRYENATATRPRKFLFTVFARNHYGLERVYQLEVNQATEQIKNSHELPHEHIGAVRIVGGEIWRRWEYDAALRYFCGQTHIEFQPPLSAPLVQPRRKR